MKAIKAKEARMQELVIQFVVAAVATVSFSLLFGVPRHYYPFGGLIGAAGWVVYLLLESYGTGTTESILVATMIVSFLSRFAAVRCRCPVTVFLIAGIIPLVPGAGIYWSTYYLVTDQVTLAAQSGFSAVKSAIAIVLGSVLIAEIPQKWFRIIMNK